MLNWWLRARLRLAAWLHALGTVIEPEPQRQVRLLPPYVVLDICDQVATAVQLQGVDDVYRQRRVLQIIKRRYRAIPDGDIVVLTLAELDAAARPPVAPLSDPQAASSYQLPPHMRRRRA